LSGQSRLANLFLELLDIVTFRFPKSFASGALVSSSLENAHMEGWWVIQCLPTLPMLSNGCPILLPQTNADLWHNIAQSQQNQRTYRNVLIQVPAASCSNLLTQVSRKQLLGQLQAYN